MASQESKTNSVKLDLLWLVLCVLVAISMLLQSGLHMTACSSTQESPPEILVVDRSEVTRNDDGTYTVTEGWMMRRLEYEQALQLRLEQCELRLEQ